MPAGPFISSGPANADAARTSMEQSTTAVWALTDRGCELGRRLAAELGSPLFVPRKYAVHPAERVFRHFASAFSEQFFCFQHHVCIAATGIVVRCMAPLLQDKARDPGVVVLDQEGRYAVSLVGGHLGGANDLARRLAGLSGGQAVITTATDTAGLPALDLLARDLGLSADRPQRFATLASALLDGESVQLFDPARLLWPRLCEGKGASLFMDIPEPSFWRQDRPGVWVSWRRPPESPGVLGLHPRCLAVGLGCHRGVSEAAITAFVHAVLAQHGLAPASLAVLATVQARAVERGLHRAAESLGVQTLFFTPEELCRVPTPNPSMTAARLIGTPSVCEAAALLAADAVRLLMPKIKGDCLTLAVALRTSPNDLCDCS